MNFGAIVTVDFGTPVGSEVGFRRPAIVVTADAFLRFRPTTLLVVPLTSTRREFPSHVLIGPDERNALDLTSYAQVELLRSVSIQRCLETGGNTGPEATHQILDILAMITGMP